MLCLPVFFITLWCAVCWASNKCWRQSSTNTDENTITNLQGWCQTSQISLRYTSPEDFHTAKCWSLYVFYGFYFLVTMKDCKNRHSDQRHMWDWWEEKEFISSWRKWVCCSRLSKSKVEAAELLARLLWEPGAQNHLRSPTLLPRGHPCPLQALYQCLKAL